MLRVSNRATRMGYKSDMGSARGGENFALRWRVICREMDDVNALREAKFDPTRASGRAFISTGKALHFDPLHFVRQSLPERKLHR